MISLGKRIHTNEGQQCWPSDGKVPPLVGSLKGMSAGQPCMIPWRCVTCKRAGARHAAAWCRWFTRYAGWGPGQLARECTSGVWLTAAASSALLLQQDPGVARTDSGRAMWHQVPARRPFC